MKRHNRKVPEERAKERYEDLKAENRKLRKEVAQLRKEFERLKNRDEGLQELIEEFSHHEEVPTLTDRASKFACTNCGSHNLKFMSLRYDDSHFSCNECGKAGPVK